MPEKPIANLDLSYIYLRNKMIIFGIKEFFIQNIIFFQKKWGAEMISKCKAYQMTDIII